MDWSCDGRHLASGSLDKTISVFTAVRLFKIVRSFQLICMQFLDLQTPDRLSKEQTYKGHTDSVDQIAWHPSDPELLVRKH